MQVLRDALVREERIRAENAVDTVNRFQRIQVTPEERERQVHRLMAAWA